MADCATEQLCLTSQTTKALFSSASRGCCASDVKLLGTNLPTHTSSSNLSPLPHTTNSNSLSLTDVNHIYVHWVWEGAAQLIGGHHGDVVVDPDGRVVLVEEAGVFSGRVVVRALVHSVGAAGGKWENVWRAICTCLDCAKSPEKRRKEGKKLLPTEEILDPKSGQLMWLFLWVMVVVSLMFSSNVFSACLSHLFQDVLFFLTCLITHKGRECTHAQKKWKEMDAWQSETQWDL